MVSVPTVLRQQVREMMSSHWREPGYTCPNAQTYPWLWLWDSCFHSIIWAELDRPDRAVSELEAIFVGQDTSGFVPHMGYFGSPDVAANFWGRSGFSSISQPPMFGHAINQLTSRGIEVPETLLGQATAGLLYLGTRNRDGSGLVQMVHPWETGADDSPRWDGLIQGEYSLNRWKELKGELLGTIRRGVHGEPLSNPMCDIYPISLNALIAFNAQELAAVSGDPLLKELASELSGAVRERWDDEIETWVDGGVLSGSTGRVRTAEALFALLVDPAKAETVSKQLGDPAIFGAEFGPSEVAQNEPTYDPSSYWRGPAWPQINYLLWVALKRSSQKDAAETVAIQTIEAAQRSELAEYWNPQSGAGGGAVPQSWTGLAVTMGS